VPILSVLTHARDAFVTGDLVRGRQFLAAELQRLETAKTGQNEVLDEWIGRRSSRVRRSTCRRRRDA
jgi:hypothetical protein